MNRFRLNANRETFHPYKEHHRGWELGRRLGVEHHANFGKGQGIFINHPWASNHLSPLHEQVHPAKLLGDTREQDPNLGEHRRRLGVNLSINEKDRQLADGERDASSILT